MPPTRCLSMSIMALLISFTVNINLIQFLERCLTSCAINQCVLILHQLLKLSCANSLTGTNMMFFTYFYLDYAGSDATMDGNLLTIALCKQIQSLNQEITTNGHTTYLSPEILSNQFTGMVTNLPDNAQTWAMHLKSSFVATLSIELADAISDDKIFIMPDFTTLDTGSKNLAILRSVRDRAVSY